LSVFPWRNSKLKLLQSSILTLFSDYLFVSFLLWKPNFMVIQPCVKIVIVSQLRDISSMHMSHLQNRYTNCHIIRSVKILSFLIFQVLLFDQSKELCIICSKVRHHKTSFSVRIHFFVDCFVLLRIANTSLGRKKVSPHNPIVSFLHHSAE
jgi:hypothetical protein